MFIWLTALIVACLTILTYVSTQNKSGKSFGFSILLACIWMTGMGFLISTNNHTVATFLNRFTYFVGSLIASSFLNFFFIYPHNKAPSKILQIILIAWEIILFYLFFFTNLIVYDVYNLNSVSSWGWHFGPLSLLFEVYFLSSFTIGLVKLFNDYKKCIEILIKNQIKYVFLLILFGSIIPFTISIILPRFGYFDLNWLGPISAIFWIFLMTYSITRHMLFNIKVIAIELVMFALWIISIIRICGAKDVHTTIEEASLLIISIVFGILIIRGTLHEIKQNEHIEKLTLELKKAYSKIKNENL